MYNIVGHCPKCGAPIYAPAVWLGITPPPSNYSCMCISGHTIITTTSTNGD